MHKGYFAEKFLKSHTDNQETQSMCGQFIEKWDYFEKEKMEIIQNFKNSSIEDDLYVLSHRDELS